MINSKVAQVTQEIIQRSQKTRLNYLTRINEAKTQERSREAVSCSNFAHVTAAEGIENKNLLLSSRAANIGIITSYNDMLSAHQPYYRYPEQIKQYASKEGAVAQVAGSVPAMCDGITQGTDSMELSLFSRDAIAMSAAIGLSHNVFDGIIYLGICDKIVPGLLMSSLSFGHLPSIFIPSGPMPTGISNKEKASIRQAFASGKASKDELLNAEMKAYHSPGTCTFYGTANSNQMLLECMGLQLPGSSFIAPDSPLRKALTEESVKTIIALSNQGQKLSVSEIINERSIVNAVVGLLATGGSTNHSIHLIAVAKMAGIELHWHDFSQLAQVIPLLARVYPNGDVDVNSFNNAGGVNFIINDLLSEGLMHEDVNTVAGHGLSAFANQPYLAEEGLMWKKAQQSDSSIVRRVSDPFQKTGGLQLLAGNLGESVMKVSAVATEHRKIRAPARVFASQSAFIKSFESGELEKDHVAVIRFQGPAANGMPELHKLTPLLAVLQDKGFKVALVTDGRMSGASGKVPSAIHLTPEAIKGGMISKIENGDIIDIDSNAGTLRVEVDQGTLEKRSPAKQEESTSAGSGRELFSLMRNHVNSASKGATIF